MKYYLSGIAGSGMNAIAQYLLSEGHEVTGSDRSFDRGESTDYRAFLEARGARIVAQDGKSLDHSFGQCVFSAAVEDNVPDMARAKKLGIPVITRALFLKDIFNAHDAIGIAGTSGKTTATGMLATIFIENHVDATVFCGAEILPYASDGLGGNFFKGRGRTLIAEVDESDRLIGHYRPDVAVVLNLTEDHMSVDEVLPLFESYVTNSRKVVYNKDCPSTARLINSLKKPCVSFSIKDQNADVFAERLQCLPERVAFMIGSIPFSVPVPGCYNIENALAAAAAALQKGISLSDSARALERFTGVKGRFERMTGKGSFPVIYDFAHNPAKIDSLLENAASLYSSIIVLFQPHGFGPFQKHMPLLRDIFATRLRRKDTLILGRIFDAGGTADRSVSSSALVQKLSGQAFPAFYAETREEAEAIILKRAEKSKACFILGARDRSLRDFAQKLGNSLK
jgi:UDP-N-acetylmuramate--alanine ligase